MSDSPTLAEASMAAKDLDGVMGFEPPSWDALLRGARPPSQEWDQQHEASSRVERHHREVNVFPRLSESGRALVRSQAGPGRRFDMGCVPNVPQFGFSLVPSALAPSSPDAPSSDRACLPVCHFLDAHGHHRAACARAGVLARRGFSVESVAARICREAGGRLTTNILVRDLDLDLEDPGDARRLEVVDDGLPLHGGSQLAVDTTLVSLLRRDGSARAGAGRRDGVARRLSGARAVARAVASSFLDLLQASRADG